MLILKVVLVRILEIFSKKKFNKSGRKGTCSENVRKENHVVVMKPYLYNKRLRCKKYILPLFRAISVRNRK